jgi:hypothetical protein
MHYLLTIFAALFFCAASAQSQTLKSLMYNSTNGQVVYAGTNALTFTNALSFGTNAAVTTRTNLSLGATWLTNTNVTNFRTAIGLGATNDVFFKYLEATNVFVPSPGQVTLEEEVSIMFGSPGARTTARSLAGSTNTNHPFSGFFNVIDDLNTPFTIIVSNGIILEVNEY